MVQTEHKRHHSQQSLQVSLSQGRELLLNQHPIGSLLSAVPEAFKVDGMPNTDIVLSPCKVCVQARGEAVSGQEGPNAGHSWGRRVGPQQGPCREEPVECCHGCC